MSSYKLVLLAKIPYAVRATEASARRVVRVSGVRLRYIITDAPGCYGDVRRRYGYTYTETAADAYCATSVVTRPDGGQYRNLTVLVERV